MTSRPGWWRIGLWMVVASIAGLAGMWRAQAQTNPYQRAFPQSNEEVEKVLKAMKENLSGRLPVLDGFATPGEHPLDQYERGYYQATVEVSGGGTGWSIVRVSAKVTAWYRDPNTARSGYQLLPSNGRIESDILDRLADLLTSYAAAQTGGQARPQTARPAEGNNSNGASPSANPPTQEAKTVPPEPAPSPNVENRPAATDAAVSAPSATSNGNVFSSTLNQGLAAQERASAQTQGPPSVDKADSELQAEVASLEDTLKNQAHPKNLVAVRKSGTPVVASPSLNAKTLFLASMHDEFELLDFNQDWVHVRISGLSRGWIWRDSLEMPEGIPDTQARPAPAPTKAAADLFRVEREEIAQFPGDWAPLRGKNVKILSVQQTDQNASEPGSNERLEYAKFQLDKSYADMLQKPQNLAGIVLIFDSADGGMIAATLPTLQRWKAGTLSDSALWHQCFFDPPETFGSNPPSASQ